MKRLTEHFNVKHLVGGSAVGTNNGAALDTLGYSEAMLILASGLCAATGTLTAKIQDSADGSTGWADVTGATFTALDANSDNTVQVAHLKLDGNGVKRYIRAVTVVGTATMDHTVTAVLGGDQYPNPTVVFTKPAAP